MKKRTILLIVAGVLVLLGVLAFIFGPYIYRDLIVGEAVDTPTVTTSSQTEVNPDEVVTADSIAGTWSVGMDSYAGYRVNEVLRGVDVTVVGRTSDVAGTITVANSELTAAKITVDAKTITTSESSRDSYFRANVIESNKFPTAVLTLTEPISIPATAYESKKINADVKATINLHGVTKQVTILVEVAYVNGKLQVASSVPTSWSDYGMTTPSLGFVEVEDSGFIEFLVNFEKQ